MWKGLEPPRRVTRERLVEFVERYLEALVAKDPSHLPLAPGVRFTENGQELALGEGLWATITGREPGGHCFADPTTSQVAWWGAIRETGRLAILALRLGLDGDGIAEVETLVVRQGGALFDPLSLSAPRPLFLETVEPAGRGNREDLIWAANRYFTGIERNDGSIIPLADDCIRMENGVLTAGGRARNEDAPWRSLGVAEQISAGHFRYIAAIRDRRFPVIDEERGLVLAHVRFDHPGHIPNSDGRVPFGYPNSALIHEVFKVREGRIRHVEAVGTIVPYRMRSGWGGGEAR
jgi:hypothetical protein